LQELVAAVARIVDSKQLRLWFDLTFIHDIDTLVAQGREKILTWDCVPGDAIVGLLTTRRRHVR
jgi:hypothetical protein